MIFVFTACTKITTTSIGTGLIPPVDGITTKDTSLLVSAKNFLDSIPRIIKGDDYVVGYANDPVFGETEAKINLEIKPGSYPFSFPVSKDSLTIDSVVLVLSYKGAWGDSLLPVALRVHEISLTDTLKKDSSYLTSRNFLTAGELTTGPTLIDVRRLKDSIKVFQDSGINMIRIKLSNTFGDRLKSYTSANQYLNDSAFRKNFAGFQITADHAPGNALIRVGPFDDNTKLAIYYRHKSTTVADSMVQAVSYFRTSSNSGSANYIHRERSAEIKNVLASANVEDSLLYLQTSPGVSAKVKIPGLAGLANAVIHRAELVMEQVPYETNPNVDKSFVPPALMLAADNPDYLTDSTGRFIIPGTVDFSSGAANLSQFGVTARPKINSGGATTGYLYNFDITRYVQGVVTQKDPTYSLILYAPYSEYIYPTKTNKTQVPLANGAFNTVAIGRTRLGGGNNSSYRMRLHIVYSLL